MPQLIFSELLGLFQTESAMRSGRRIALAALVCGLLLLLLSLAGYPSLRLAPGECALAMLIGLELKLLDVD